MTEFNLKTDTPATAFPGFLFGAGAQADANPDIYPIDLIAAMAQHSQYSFDNAGYILAPPPTNGATLGSATVTANRLYAIPLVVGKEQTFDAIGVMVSTFAAGNCRIGIRNAPLGSPIGGTTLIADLGTVSVATSNGLKEITGLARTLAAGRYVVNLLFDVTPVVAAVPIGSITPTLGYVVNSTTFNITAYAYRAFTYGALPADETAETYTKSNNTSCPIASLRVI